MGPTYCETPLLLTGFPVEPINTISNLIIIAFGIVALWLVYRRAGKEFDLWAVAVFLTVTCVGSLLWHGFRTSLFLTLDYTPGMLALLAILLAWARRLFGSWWAALLSVVVFICVVSAGSALVGLLGDFRFFFAGPLVAVLGIGGYFVYRSYRLWGRVALVPLLGMGSALLALMFRTIDSQMCAYIPFGTHFLWHTFLSLGAFLCFYFLLKISERSRGGE